MTRLEERSGDGFSLTEAHALCHLLEGRLGEAANASEEFLKTQQILRIFVGAMRMERFDADVAVKMLAAGHDSVVVRDGETAVGTLTAEEIRAALAAA